MRRYLLFAGAQCYPKGGWMDFINSFDDPQIARSVAVAHIGNDYDWCQIVDSSTFEVMHLQVVNF